MSLPISASAICRVELYIDGACHAAMKARSAEGCADAVGIMPAPDGRHTVT